jgi:polyisoprenoid-binding protein YceI
MPTFGPDDATCEVLVFREGVLARAGHDLLLHVTRFTISTEPVSGAVTALVDAGSLRVATALRGGRPMPDALSAKDVREIEHVIATTVLQAARFPSIRFASEAVTPRDGGFDVRGALTLAGATRAIAFPVRRDAERLVAEVQLAQPDFGIRPYTAMLGALRVKPVVTVRVAVPVTAG